MDIVRGRFKSVDVRQDGRRVLVLENGVAILDLPWDAALALARALQIQAQRAEEEAKALEIIADQAILTRLGIPFGLTSRPDMLREAAKEAAWNSRLRRLIRPGRAGGIASQAVFGTPTITRHDPKEEEQ